MAALKDTQHDLTPDPGPEKDRGVPDGLDESDAKGAPTNDRQDSETAGDEGSKK